jgi:hypothetical protein
LEGEAEGSEDRELVLLSGVDERAEGEGWG